MDFIIEKLRRRTKYIYNIFDFHAHKIFKLYKFDSDVVLLYHGMDQNNRSDINWRFISIKNFISQILFFKRYFDLVSLTEIFENRIIKKKPRFAITFDDGYKNWFTILSPTLKSLQIPVTLFITTLKKDEILWTDKIDICSQYQKSPIIIDDLEFIPKYKKFMTKNGMEIKSYIKMNSYKTLERINNQLEINTVEFNKNRIYWELLDNEEIIALSKIKNVEIGSHASSHISLDMITSEEVKEEVTYSKIQLENLIQKEIVSFSFPSGRYNNQLIDQIEKLGYKYQLTESYNSTTELNDSRILDRFGIYNSGNNATQLKSVINKIMK